MAIKSSQTLVQEALNEIETISPDEALKLSKNIFTQNFNVVYLALNLKIQMK